MVTALFPGSFDPVTNGHLDLITRAAQIFDHVVVAVGFNMAKPGWMSVAQRVELLRRTVEDQLELDNVSVGQFEGLTTDYAEHVGATVIIKGGRSSADWDWEYTQAAVNRKLSGIDTLILPADSQWATLSSSIVRELARYGAPLEGLVPPLVAAAIDGRHSELSQQSNASTLDLEEAKDREDGAGKQRPVS